MARYVDRAGLDAVPPPAEWPAAPGERLVPRPSPETRPGPEPAPAGPRMATARDRRGDQAAIDDHGGVKAEVIWDWRRPDGVAVGHWRGPAPRPGNVHEAGPLESLDIHKGSVMAKRNVRPAVSGPLAVAVCVLVLGLAGAVVALAFAGWSPEAIIGFTAASGAGLASVLAVVGRMLTITADQTQTLSEIHDHTNGELRALIQREVRTAIGQTVAKAVKEAYGAGRDEEADAR
jgi:hypothetical protein